MAAQESVKTAGGETEPESQQIAEQIAKTHESLTNRLSRLEDEVEDRVRHTVDQVSGQILDSVDHIKGTVKSSMDRLQDKVDLRRRVEREPLKTLGGVLLAGLAFGAWRGLRQRRSMPLHHQQQLPSARLKNAAPAAQQQHASQQFLPLVRGILGTIAVSAAQRLIQRKVDHYLLSLEQPSNKPKPS